MVNTRRSQHTQLQSAILSLLTKRAGEKLNQRAIANTLSVTPAAVSRALPTLEEQGFITIENSKTMNLKLVSLNREARKVINWKRVENLRALYDSGLVEALAERYAGSTIILFGSYARGEDTVRSDIDLAVIGKEKPFDPTAYERLLERPIRILFFDSFGALSEEFKESLCNGIVLVGGVKL